MCVCVCIVPKYRTRLIDSFEISGKLMAVVINFSLLQVQLRELMF